MTLGRISQRSPLARYVGCEIHVTTIPKAHYTLLYLGFAASACRSATPRCDAYLLKLSEVSRGLLRVFGGAAAKLVLDLQELDRVRLHLGVRACREVGGSSVSCNVGLGVRLFVRQRREVGTYRVNAGPANFSPLLLTVSRCFRNSKTHRGHESDPRAGGSAS